jgi:maleylpyruvate isomerase
MRTREVWVHAVDLDNGASFGDVPASVLERLLADITSAWAARGTDAGLLIKVSGTDRTFGDPDAAVVVAGPLAGVVQWATGRGTDGVAAGAGQVPAAPKWI